MWSYRNTEKTDREGFEPPRAKHIGFQNQLLKPLGHLSISVGSHKKRVFPIHIYFVEYYLITQ